MAAFSISTHKLLASSSQNLKDAQRVDGRDLLARLLLDAGLFSITSGNTAPVNKDVLWFHVDVKTLKRFDAVAGNWVGATPNQIAMHIWRRAVLGSVTEINLENGDLFTFWDTSLGEVKVISRENLMSALGALRTIATSEGVQGGGTLGANRTLRLDFSALTGKANPASSDVLALYGVTEETHLKITFSQLAGAVATSDAIHARMFFLGMM